MAGYRRDSHVGHTQVVFMNELVANAEVAEVAEVAQEAIDNMIDRLGVRLIKERCERLVFNGVQGQDALAGSTASPSRQRVVMLCPAVIKTAPDLTLLAQRRQAAEVMDAFEAKCPRFLRPAGQQVEGTRDLWTRRYRREDLFLQVDFANDQIRYRQEHQGTSIAIGRVESWRSDLERFACALPHSGKRGIETLRSSHEVK